MVPLEWVAEETERIIEEGRKMDEYLDRIAEMVVVVTWMVEFMEQLI